MIQNITSNVRQRAGAVGQTYRGLWKTCRDTQRQAVKIVARNSRSITNTEIGAAKNIYTSARAAFNRARVDGVRQIARKPGRYVPAGRKQTAAAYRATLKLLNKTRDELSEVAVDGYREISTQLRGMPAAQEKPLSEAKVASAKTDRTPEPDLAKKAEPAKTPRKKAARRSTTATASAKSTTGPKTKRPRQAKTAEPATTSS